MEFTIRIWSQHRLGNLGNLGNLALATLVVWSSLGGLAQAQAVSVLPPPTKQLLSQTAADSGCNPQLVDCAHRGLRFAWSEQPIPYLVSPRRTRMLNSRPLIRWLPVAGASQYTITVTGEGLEWQAQTPDTQLPYSGAPLEPGGEYRVIIETDTGASSLDEPSHPGGIAFAVVTVSEREAIAAQAQVLGEDVGAIAQLYLDNGLLAEGIAQLEMLWAQQRASQLPNSQIALHLGNLYFEQLLLPTLARNWYETALVQTETLDPREQALALAQLGHVWAVMHDSERAIAYWQQAQQVYAALGDASQVQRLQDYIEEEQELLGRLQQ
ncbi:MAG: hypothetical protein ACPGVO_00725 [Spirulinaceae cyanobacterium]